MDKMNINQPPMQGAPGMYVKEVDGKEIYFYVNDNGAIIEIVDVRPNTFEDGFYFETGCTVDIDINVYNDDFSIKKSFFLKDVDTKESCWDWFDGFWEGELEYILSCEDENGNYDGREEDKEFYLAAKKCEENGWDFCDHYDWEDFRTEQDYEDYCWELITNTDYTNDQMAQLDVIKKGIPKLGSSKDIYEAVDVEGTFQIYEAAAPLGDGMLYGDTLLEGNYSIKGIKTGTEEEMMDRTVRAIIKWAKQNDFESQNYVCIDKSNFDYGNPYPCNLKEPIVLIEED